MSQLSQQVKLEKELKERGSSKPKKTEEKEKINKIQSQQRLNKKSEKKLKGQTLLNFTQKKDHTK